MKNHYIYLVGGVVIAWKNFLSDNEAREYAHVLSKERDALVGVYKMIGST